MLIFQGVILISTTFSSALDIQTPEKMDPFGPEKQTQRSDTKPQEVWQDVAGFQPPGMGEILKNTKEGEADADDAEGGIWRGEQGRFGWPRNTFPKN